MVEREDTPAGSWSVNNTYYPLSRSHNATHIQTKTVHLQDSSVGSSTVRTGNARKTTLQLEEVRFIPHYVVRV